MKVVVVSCDCIIVFNSYVVCFSVDDLEWMCGLGGVLIDELYVFFIKYVKVQGYSFVGLLLIMFEVDEKIVIGIVWVNLGMVEGWVSWQVVVDVDGCCYFIL